MAGARLNEADAARLARHYGKSVSEFAAVVGADAGEAATRLGLPEDDLSAALKKSALAERERVDNEENRRAQARRDANATAEGANQIKEETLAPPSPETLSDGTPVDLASDAEVKADKRAAKKTTKKTAKKTTKKTAAKKTAKKTPAKKTAAKRSAAKK